MKPISSVAIGGLCIRSRPRDRHRIFQVTDRRPRPFSVPDALLREDFLPDTLQTRVVSCQFPGIIVRGWHQEAR